MPRASAVCFTPFSNPFRSSPSPSLTLPLAPDTAPVPLAVSAAATAASSSSKASPILPASASLHARFPALTASCLTRCIAFATDAAAAACVVCRSRRMTSKSSRPAHTAASALTLAPASAPAPVAVAAAAAAAAASAGGSEGSVRSAGARRSATAVAMMRRESVPGEGDHVDTQEGRGKDTSTTAPAAAPTPAPVPAPVPAAVPAAAAGTRGGATSTGSGFRRSATSAADGLCTCTAAELHIAAAFAAAVAAVVAAAGRKREVGVGPGRTKVSRTDGDAVRDRATAPAEPAAGPAAGTGTGAGDGAGR